MEENKIYKNIMDFKKKNKLTYTEIAKKMDMSISSLHDSFTRLKKEKSVHSNFLLKLENRLGIKIFY
jgi:hypothetical protein